MEQVYCSMISFTVFQTSFVPPNSIVKEPSTCFIVLSLWNNLPLQIRKTDPLQFCKGLVKICLNWRLAWICIYFMPLFYASRLRHFALYKCILLLLVYCATLIQSSTRRPVSFCYILYPVHIFFTVNEGSETQNQGRGPDQMVGAKVDIRRFLQFLAGQQLNPPKIICSKKYSLFF